MEYKAPVVEQFERGGSMFNLCFIGNTVPTPLPSGDTNPVGLGYGLLAYLNIRKAIPFTSHRQNTVICENLLGLVSRGRYR